MLPVVHSPAYSSRSKEGLKIFYSKASIPLRAQLRLHRICIEKIKLIEKLLVQKISLGKKKISTLLTEISSASNLFSRRFFLVTNLNLTRGRSKMIEYFFNWMVRNLFAAPAVAVGTTVNNFKPNLMLGNEREFIYQTSFMELWKKST